MHSHVLCCLKTYTNLLSVSLMMLFVQHTALEKSSTSDRVKKVKKKNRTAINICAFEGSQFMS